MPPAKTPWLTVQKPLPPGRNTLLMVLAFLIPLGVWCAVSYVPWIWHPMVRVVEKGGAGVQEGKLYDAEQFVLLNQKAIDAGKAPAVGEPANPVFLPEPHKVATALYTAFTEEPSMSDKLWFHQRIFESIRVIFWGFLWASVFGVPIGVLCGTFPLFSRATEPFIDFVRYMPAPAFGTLMVAILGTQEAPKVAIIFIGTFFQMVLVLANTTRTMDGALLEAAQTLGARRKRLVWSVIVPGVLPKLYIDMRILLGWAWTYLIVAELIGEKSGVTAFIQQQARYFRFENVYAGILIIGLLGLGTDQALQFIGRFLFPWEQRAPRGFGWLAPVARRVRAVHGRLMEEPYVANQRTLEGRTGDVHVA